MEKGRYWGEIEERRYFSRVISRNVLKQQPFPNNRVSKQYFPDDSLYRRSRKCIKRLATVRVRAGGKGREEGERLKPLKGWFETSPPRRGEIAIKCEERERRGRKSLENPLIRRVFSTAIRNGTRIP